MRSTSAPLQPSAASSALRLSTRGTATCRVSFPKIFTVLYYNDRTGSAASRSRVQKPDPKRAGRGPPPGPWRNFRSERVVRNRPDSETNATSFNIVPAGRSDRSESAEFFLIFSTGRDIAWRTRPGGPSLQACI